MVIVGLAMGLYGYDNAFASPLVQLPLFIEKYQGPGISFTVSAPAFSTALPALCRSSVKRPWTRLLAQALTRRSAQARNLDLIISVPLVAAAVGCFAASPIMKRFGRKRTNLIAYICCCTPGAFLQLFAPNEGALVFGRAWNCE